jgi:hypothetical protein
VFLIVTKFLQFNSDFQIKVVNICYNWCTHFKNISNSFVYMSVNQRSKLLLRGFYRSLILTAGKTILLAAQKSNLHNLFTQLLVLTTYVKYCALSIWIVPNLHKNSLSHCIPTIFIAPCMPLCRQTVWSCAMFPWLVNDPCQIFWWRNRHLFFLHFISELVWP